MHQAGLGDKVMRTTTSRGRGGARRAFRRSRPVRPAAAEPRPPARKQPTNRAAKSEARRAAIVQAALDEFCAGGFAATRIDDVAARAGVANGTIYLYFDDKEALFREIVTTMLVPLVATLEAPPPDLPVRAVITRFMELFVREIYSTQRRNVLRLVMTEGPRFPELAEFHYRNVVERAIAAMRALLTRAHERGELKDDTLIRFPQLIVAPALVAIVWSGLFDRFAPLDVEALMRAHIDTLFEGSVP
jgi:AcrR family transcriptional regulator